MNFTDVRHGVIVLAHPDDESLWCGGLMIRYPSRWTVICCSIPQADPIRAWKFFAACDVLGAKARLLPYGEPAPMQEMTGLGDLDLSGYDCIVTHNARGEYGNPHHQFVHRHIVSMVPQSLVVTIGYREGGEGIFYNYKIVLTDAEVDRKFAAICCYDHRSIRDNGKRKSEALIERYAPMFDLNVETYDLHCI